MREIKFRAWDDEAKMFFYWGFIGNSFVGLTQNSNNPRSLMELQEASEQYIGLKDKNGKEIYDGDIVRTHRRGKNEHIDGVIGWSKSNFQWVIKRTHIKKCNLPLTLHSSAFEIIGNIYKNPELI